MSRRSMVLVVGLSMTAGPSLVLAAESATRAGSERSDVLEEIVVTAERRSEGLQTLPNAISVYSGEVLAASGITGVAALTQVSPSVIWGESAGEPHLSIRGIGNELINIGAEGGVTISRDGVPLASPLMSRRGFMDTASIEVLRGPQGTVSGRNSPGGAVNLYSSKPTETPEGDLSVGYGNFNRIQASGVLSGPISGDSLLGRLAVSYVNDDGWLENTFQDQKQNSADNLTYRGYLTYQSSDTFNASLIVEGFENNGFELAGVDAGRVQPHIPSLSEFALGHGSFDIDDLTFQENTPGPFTGRGHQYTLRAEWGLGASGKLTSITAYQDFRQQGMRDYDATPVSFEPSTPGYLIEDLEQFSQELTYTTDIGERTDLVVGALYMKQDADEPFGLGATTFEAAPLQFLVHQEITSAGVYAQLRYKLTDELRLTVGDRYTRDEKTYDQTLFIVGSPTVNPTVEDSWSAQTPRLALDYTPSDSVTYYLNVARGFTAGGFNTFSGEKFKPQYVTSYDVGLKSYWLDRRLKVNLSAFHSDFKDIQTVLFVPVEGGVTASLSVKNAGAAKIDGVEAEVEAQLSDGFRLTATATWLDARYTELESVDGSIPEAGVLDLSGNKLPRSPEWQTSVGANYDAPISQNWNVSLVANYAWQDKVYFNFFNQPLMSQDAYGLVNLSAALYSSNDDWRVTVFCNNAADERYWSNMQFGTGLPVPYTNGMIGEPRTYGITVSRHF